jgi:LacI family transcriptional regulator
MEPDEVVANGSSRGVRTIAMLADGVLRQPYAGGLLASAHLAARRHRAVLVLMTTPADSADGDPHDTYHASSPIDGVVVADWGPVPLTSPLSHTKVPHARLNTSGWAGPDGLACVDHEKVSGSIVHELLELHHVRIGYTGARSLNGGRDAWFKGVAKALLEADTFDPALIFLDEATATGGRRCGLMALRRADPATAMICFNARMAMGVYQAARECGVGIPGRLSVIALEDAEMIGTELRPALTTYQIPYAELATEAVDRLLNAGELSIPDRSDTPAGQMIYRDSTGPAPSR